jgi:hypothetical protein
MGAPQTDVGYAPCFFQNAWPAGGVGKLSRNKTPESGFQTVVATGLMTKPRSLARRLSAAMLR